MLYSFRWTTFIHLTHKFRSKAPDGMFMSVSSKYIKNPTFFSLCQIALILVFVLNLHLNVPEVKS